MCQCENNDRLYFLNNIESYQSFIKYFKQMLNPKKFTRKNYNFLVTRELVILFKDNEV